MASENIKWGISEPYFSTIASITTTTTPAQLANLFTTTYTDTMAGDTQLYTMSTADVSKFSNVLSATHSLADALNNLMTTRAITLTTVVANVQRFDQDGNDVINSSDSYIDLYDFARLTKLNFADSTVQSAAQGVMDAVNAYIIAEGHQDPTKTFGVGNSHGVSIFFPSSRSSFYNGGNYDFATGVVWSGGAGQSLNNNQDIIAWGPMLVNYFQITQPGGPDNPDPPQPIPQILETQNIYLPLVIK